MKSDPFETFIVAHPEGSRIVARVDQVAQFGVFCELASDVTGLLLVPDFAVAGPKQFPEDYPKIGDVIDVTIAFINQEHRKIRLSQRSAAEGA